ncbi:S9 family peptidase [SAR92 clade bacterium H231]|nr:S9 family peptidase [SAR92 clade bacterium H231]
MTDHPNTTISAQEMEARYQRAQTLMQGIHSKSLVFNTTLVPHWIGDSDHFWYEREFRSGKEFRLVDAAARSNDIAFDHEALARTLANASGKATNAEDLPISKIDMSLSPLQLTFDAFGKRWIFTSPENTCTEIETYPNDWLISPDGGRAAFVRDYNIWVRDLRNSEEHALTQDGERFYSYASTPSAWGLNLLSPNLEALWSPDSKRLFTLQQDTRLVKTLPMIQHVPQDGSTRPVVVGANRRVAFPGDDHIDEYRFLAIDVETGQQHDAHYRRCPVFRPAMGGFFTYHYGWWAEDSRLTYFIDLERGGDRLARLVEFDTHTGATRVVIEEASPNTCFQLRLDSRWPILVKPLPNSDEVIWYSERSGWGHLYLYNLQTGQLKHPITEGAWIVREIHHYDPERRELIIQTADRVEGRHAYYRDICRVHIDTGELTPILSTDHEYIIFEEGSELALNLQITRDIWGSAGVSATGNYLVTTRSRANEVPESILLDRAGNKLLTLETADISGLPDGWQWPEPVKLLAADGKTDIYGVVYRPANFSPDQSYPVLDYSYNTKEGGPLPAGSFTNNSVTGAFYLGLAAVAQLGFIVVEIYGRGTSCRHRDFLSTDLDPKLPSSKNQADRVAGIRQLAERYPYMDLDRVGAGAIVAMATPVSSLLGYPDFYKVGVCNGAFFDLSLAPAFNGEAYGGLPATSNIRKSPRSHVKDFKGKLLIMHGLLNQSVNVNQSFSLIDALQQANKDFDMLLLPNDGYGMSSYATRRGWDYLVKHLLGAEPPPEFKLTTSNDLIWQSAAAKEQAAAANS